MKYKIKGILITLAVVFFLVVSLQSFMLMSTNKTEEQIYSIIQKDKDFEIRFYPSATMATIISVIRHQC